MDMLTTNVDMLISWMVFGILTTILAGVIEGYSSREDVLSSSFSALSGSILGGAFGEMVSRSTESAWHISPLIFASVGAIMFMTLARDRLKSGF